MHRDSTRIGDCRYNRVVGMHMIDRRVGFEMGHTRMHIVVVVAVVVVVGCSQNNSWLNNDGKFWQRVVVFRE